GRVEMVAVYEVEIRPVPDAVEERVAWPMPHLVPAYVRDAFMGRGLDQFPYLAGNQSQPFGFAPFVSFAAQELHAETDPEKRDPNGYDGFADGLTPGLFPDPGHSVAVSADTGQHDMGGRGQVRRVVDYRDRRAA